MARESRGLRFFITSLHTYEHLDVGRRTSANETNYPMNANPTQTFRVRIILVKVYTEPRPVAFLVGSSWLATPGEVVQLFRMPWYIRSAKFVRF